MGNRRKHGKPRHRRGPPNNRTNQNRNEFGGQINYNNQGQQGQGQAQGQMRQGRNQFENRSLPSSERNVMYGLGQEHTPEFERFARWRHEQEENWRGGMNERQNNANFRRDAIRGPRQHDPNGHRYGQDNARSGYRNGNGGNGNRMEGPGRNFNGERNDFGTAGYRHQFENGNMGTFEQQVATFPTPIYGQRLYMCYRGPGGVHFQELHNPIITPQVVYIPTGVITPQGPQPYEPNATPMISITADSPELEKVAKYVFAGPNGIQIGDPTGYVFPAPDGFYFDRPMEIPAGNEVLNMADTEVYSPYQIQNPVVPNQEEVKETEFNMAYPEMPAVGIPADANEVLYVADSPILTPVVPNQENMPEEPEMTMAPPEMPMESDNDEISAPLIYEADEQDEPEAANNEPKKADPAGPLDLEQAVQEVLEDIRWDAFADLALHENPTPQRRKFKDTYVPRAEVQVGYSQFLRDTHKRTRRASNKRGDFMYTQKNSDFWAKLIL